MMVATLGIALPEIRQTFSLTALQAGSLFSVMMLIAAVTSGIAGRLADRIGRKTVLITGLSLLASGFGFAGISGHPLFFFLLLAVTGIGYGFTPPSLYAIMSDLLPNRRGLGASLVSVTYGIGGAIGAVLASRITAAFGWRAAFVTVGIIAAADMLLQLCWIRDTPSKTDGGAIRLVPRCAVVFDFDSRPRGIHRRLGVLGFGGLDADAAAHRQASQSYKKRAGSWAS